MEYLIPAILVAAAIVAAVIYATRRPRRPAVIDRARVRRDATAGPLRRLLADTVRELDCAEATIWTISPDGLHLEGALNHGPTMTVVENITVPANDSVIGLVAEQGLAKAIGPADWHNPSVDKATGTATLAMAAAPIDVRGERVGVLSAINPLAGGVFGGEALRALVSRAEQAGTLLEQGNRGAA
jgi:hypothetical protein